MPVWLNGKEFLDIKATIECGFTLTCEHDMAREHIAIQS